ncbi:peptide-methionine (R)-S-oxide reductase MsrB [Pseudomonas sp. RL_15y_Pfl2_60]|uniref:peptide-methionine (R)-S-oxide reductase MsrB n=1 Tax=Pseudomonas sp. RL_15y_Pfl2_60 TaxID=3088709 RepID=UPI0030DDC283
MKRRSFLHGLALLPAAPLLGSLIQPAFAETATTQSAITPLNKAHEAWRKILAQDAYAVLFEEDTERPNSSPLNHEKRVGTYICAACYLPLFLSENKFDSGTGWPSFTQPIAGHTGSKRDFKLLWPRTEYHCIRCGGHQGHLFNDGPAPRGERWCNNGVALKFVAKGQDLPALRS